MERNFWTWVMDVLVVQIVVMVLWLYTISKAIKLYTLNRTAFYISIIPQLTVLKIVLSKAFDKNFHIDFQRTLPAYNPKKKSIYYNLKFICNYLLYCLWNPVAGRYPWVPMTLTMGLLSKVKIYLIPFQVSETIFTECE